MAQIQTKFTSFITSLAIANLDKPALYRTDSASSFASDSSGDSMTDTELQPWEYEHGHKRRGSEQDEVKRKRRELAEKRRRASDVAWRSFWP
jgi:hypothetical protein